MPIDSKELGFTRPGPYIYELLGDLNITYETSNMLMDTIDQAADLLEEGEITTLVPIVFYPLSLCITHFLLLSLLKLKLFFLLIMQDQNLHCP